MDVSREETPTNRGNANTGTRGQTTVSRRGWFRFAADLGAETHVSTKPTQTVR